MLATPRILTATFFLTGACCLVLLSIPAASQDHSGSSNGRSPGLPAGRSHAELPIHVVLHGEQASDWVNIEQAKLSLTSHGGPIMIGLVAEGQPLSPTPAIGGLSFQIPTFGAVNRWLISIVRDYSFEVSVYSIGHSTHSDLPGLYLPSSFLNVDIVPPGLHTYTLRVKYIGSPHNGPNNLPGQMQFEATRFIGLEL